MRNVNVMLEKRQKPAISSRIQAPAPAPACQCAATRVACACRQALRTAQVPFSPSALPADASVRLRGGALQEQPRHSWQRSIAGTPWSFRRRRPLAAAHRLPHVQHGSFCQLCRAASGRGDCPAITLHYPSLGVGEWSTAGAAQTQLAAPHRRHPLVPPPPPRTRSVAPLPLVQRSAQARSCPATTLHPY